MSDAARAALRFWRVLREELTAVEWSRWHRGVGTKPPDDSSASTPQAVQPPPAEKEEKGEEELKRETYKQAHEKQLVGLAFSGGGIRSATFNLGILQGLASLGLLKKFDYLSTVSGGGYIGSWLTGWIRRAGDLKTVAANLIPDRTEQPCGQEPTQIHFLRDYSNYLTPRKGLFTVDTWTAVAIYLRNLLVNWPILLGVLTAVLLLPRLLVWASQQWILAGELWVSALYWMGVLVVAIWLMGCNLVFLAEGKREKNPWYTRRLVIHFLISLPILSAAWLLGCWLLVFAEALKDLGWLDWAGLGAGAYFALWVLGWLLGDLFVGGPPRCPPGEEEEEGMEEWMARAVKNPLATARQLRTDPIARRKVFEAGKETLQEAGKTGFNWFMVILCAAAAGAVGGLLLGGLTAGFWALGQQVGGTDKALWLVVSVGTILVIWVFKLTVALHIGLAGRTFSTQSQEWWGRLGGILFIYTLLWLVLFGTAVLAPQLIRAWDWKDIWTQAVGGGLGVGWLATTVGGVLAGRSQATGARRSNWRLELLARFAPYVFVVGLLVGLSLFVHMGLLHFQAAWTQVPWQSYWGELQNSLTSDLYTWLYSSLAVAVVMSLLVDVNEFSMHGFYRNRLVRSYLGATRAEERNPHPFTGFDPADDLPLADLDSQPRNGPSSSYQGPIPILNATLNLTRGEELAWQTRKGASFVFTPRYCGYEYLPRKKNTGSPWWLEAAGYRPTAEYGGRVQLGTAMAISGAAVSPNMGYHSSAPLAFLMTVFNVRLGWWLGNPRHRWTWDSASPRLALYYLISELLGVADDQQEYVYLSDGGHFENLGIYELVRRRCRLIVACDAEQDEKLEFGGLGNAIEKCRTDFGIDIKLNVDPIRIRDERGYSQWHCAVGTIRYDKVDGGALPGLLLYIKSALTGEEPEDVKRYDAQNPEFPHQTTADQWFGESQFESYRALGYHIARTVFEGVVPAAEDEQEAMREPIDTEEWVVRLRQRWYPPSAAIAASFTKHTETLMDIWRTIAADPNLRFLDAQVYPEWPQLVRGAKPPPQQPPPVAQPPQLWLPDSYEERRAGFHICIQMIQLMENAYLDLNLEEEYDHPDNRGWMNFFKHWSWAGMFQVTWAISASIYGARFQSFCRRHLDLNIEAQVEVGAALELGGSEEEVLEALQTAREKEVLNFWEVELLKQFHYYNGLTPEDRVYPLQIEVRSVTGPGTPMVFTFGFALVRPVRGVLRCFRVQDHLRRTGLARAALKKLVEQNIVQRVELELTPTDGGRPLPSQAKWVQMKKTGVFTVPTVPSLREVRKIQWMFRSVQT